ncbi:MAG TPA: hypothetical protein VFH38_00505 [Jatrophihabitans sp.]|nr:hypothetical protein [Jatrophihabitans sp.]
MADTPADGSGSAAAQQADATGAVERNTKSETTAASYTTTEHDVIRAWAEARGGCPAVVESTEDADQSGILRIDFRDDAGSLDDVEWEPFFRTFDERGLAFVYQEQTSDGSQSRFNKFVRRSA